MSESIAFFKHFNYSFKPRIVASGKISKTKGREIPFIKHTHYT